MIKQYCIRGHNSQIHVPVRRVNETGVLYWSLEYKWVSDVLNKIKY